MLGIETKEVTGVNGLATKVRRNGAGRVLREIGKHKALYLLILIPLAVLLIFQYAPMYGVQIAFRNYKVTKGITGSEWVGLKYILKFFNYHRFWEILWNTLRINLYSLLTFPLSLLLALCVNYLPSRRFSKTVQMVSYAPHFLSTVVVVGMILQFMDMRTGLFNAVMSLFGVAPVNYMAKPEYFTSIYVWSDAWQGTGYSSIIYIAALAGISQELHEAAIVDGANIPQRIWHVDIPGVLPTFCILLILRCGSLISIGFEKILLMHLQAVLI